MKFGYCLAILATFGLAACKAQITDPEGVLTMAAEAIEKRDMKDLKVALSPKMFEKFGQQATVDYMSQRLRFLKTQYGNFKVQKKDNGIAGVYEMSVVGFEVDPVENQKQIDSMTDTLVILGKKKPYKSDNLYLDQPTELLSATVTCATKNNVFPADYGNSLVHDTSATICKITNLIPR